MSASDSGTGRGAAGSIAIDPDRVRSAATHLRSRADAAIDLDREIRLTSLEVDLAPIEVLTACAEIDEELTLLASILSARADEADGFGLPGSDWDLESTLLGSLLDNTGHRASISGSLALRLVVEHRLGIVGDGDDTATSIELLRHIAHDPRRPPEQAAAAAYLVNHPYAVSDTRPWFATAPGLPGMPISHIPLRDIERLIQRNEIITLAIDRSTRPTGAWTTLDDADLIAVGIDPIEFDELHLPRDQHELMVTAVEHGTFTHSPSAARAFVATLPVHAEDAISIDIDATDPDAVLRLHHAATNDLGGSDEESARRWQVIAHLPETTTGVRNLLFTQSYADIAHRIDMDLNEGRGPTDADFRGHNWFHLGVVASDSVGPVIRSELRIYAMPISLAVRQDIANGNQAIFAHFTDALTRRWRGEPPRSHIVGRAFDLIDDSAATDDVAASQLDIAESTALFAMAEQLVVDPYLQLDALRTHERIGTQVISGIASFGTDIRTAEEVMTDVGLLEFERDGDSIREPIAIGAEVPRSTADNNLVDPTALERRLADVIGSDLIDWNLDVAENWSIYDERMPIIVDVAVSTLTDPALTELTDHHRTKLDRPDRHLPEGQPR